MKNLNADNIDNANQEYAGAILVGVDTGNSKDFEHSMDELKALTEALFIKPVLIVTQILEHPVAATYIGSGKLDEISDYVRMYDAEYVIFEDTLSPSQLKNIADKVDAVVYDRTNLILEIFSKRAKTREARLQIETARLQYMLPRLVGMRTSLGRQAGASGAMSNKGLGEKKLELDRRHILSRISELNKELDLIEHDRSIQRKKRQKSNYPLVSLVGYTNAGKSTIMNCLLKYSEGDVLAEKFVEEKDMLFATLDTTVRKICTENKRDFLLSDTVGFIDELPHTLVKAFRSTLEEIKYADMLLQVVDTSDEHYLEQMKVTEDTLSEIGAGDIPVIYVMNKCDINSEVSIPMIKDNYIYISAKKGIGIPELIEMIQKKIYDGNKRVSLILPFDKGGIVSFISDNAQVYELKYEEDGIHIEADLNDKMLGIIEKKL